MKKILLLAGLYVCPFLFAERTVTYVARPVNYMWINIANPSAVTQTIDLELIGTGYELTTTGTYKFEGSDCAIAAPSAGLNSDMRSPVVYKCANKSSFRTLHPGYSISFRYQTLHATDPAHLKASSGILIKITASSANQSGYVIASGDQQCNACNGNVITNFPINGGRPF